MTPADFLVQQALRRYQSDLGTWSARVTRSRSLQDALRDASHKPSLPAIARGLGSMARSDAARAEARIERHLLELVSHVDPDDPMMGTYMRMAQGHWPRAWQALDRARRISGKDAT